MRLYLEELGLTYKSKMISFERQDLKAPEMLALNPRGLVPIFMDQHGNIIMYESLAIVQYLDRGELSQSKASLVQDAEAIARSADVVQSTMRTVPSVEKRNIELRFVA